MERRRMIQQLSTLAAMGLSLPALTGLVTGCQKTPSDSDEDSFFNASQKKVLRELVDLLLPKTDLPGAADLKLDLFIEKIVSSVYDEPGQKKFLTGFQNFLEECENSFGKEFLQCDLNQKKEFLIHQEKNNEPVMADVWGNPVGPKTEPGFYRQIKSLTLLGYFTSEEIGKNHLFYEPVPGKYEGCIDLIEGQKIDAL